MLPSHSHVSLRVTPPLVPPNTTAMPRSLSYAIAWSRRVLGELGGANCVQVPAAPFQSQVWGVPVSPPKSNVLFRAASNTRGAACAGGFVSLRSVQLLAA